MIVLELIALWLVGASHLYLYYLIGNFTNVTWKKLVGLGTVFFIVLNAILVQTRIPEMNFVVLFLLFFIIGWYEKKKIKEIIFATLNSVIIYTFLRNSINIGIIEIIMNTSIPYYSSTPLIISYGTICFLAFLFFLYKNKIRRFSRLVLASKWLPWVNILLVISSAILVVISYPEITILKYWNQAYGEQLLVIFLILVGILFISSAGNFFLAKRKLERTYQRKSKEQLLDYVERVEAMNEEVMMFRHDYLNILLTLEQSIQKKDISQIEEVYRQTISPTKQLINNQQLELLKLAQVEIPALKSILSAKIVQAQNKKIPLLVDIPERIAELFIQEHLFIRSISILIDNALEAVENQHNGQIQFALFNLEQTQYVIVKNSVGHVNVDVINIFQKNHSSKGENRGIGLYYLTKLLEEHRNVSLVTEVENGMFTQQLIIKKPLRKN